MLTGPDCITTLCLQALLQEVQNSVREKFGTRSKWLPDCTVTDLKHNEAQSAHTESTNKGVNLCAKDVTWKNNDKEDAPLVEFMSFVFTGMPGKSYRRRLRPLLLCLCDVFLAQINSIVCWLSLYRVDRSRYKKYKSLYKKSLAQADHVFVVVFVWCLSSTN